MANAVYPKYLVACMSGAGPDLAGATVKALLVDGADYTYSAAHEFLSDVPAGARVATSAALTGKTIGVVGVGVFDFDDFAFASVSGDGSEAIILLVDTGVEGTSRLLSFHDGFAVTPSGTNINVTVPAGGAFSI